MNANTVGGARRLAKMLCKELRRGGEDIKLSVCKNAVAKALGYKDWPELTQLLETEGADQWSDARCSNSLVKCTPDLDVAVLHQSLVSMRRSFGHWG